MLLILTVIIAILAPLIHSRIPTKAEIKTGKIYGFTGATNDRVGDYLLSTTCFCGSEGNEPPTRPFKGSSLRLFEYYAYHHNTTYMLKDLCQDAYSLEGCFINEGHDDYLCDTWRLKPAPGTKRKKDLIHNMCYVRDISWPDRWSKNLLPMADKITFDGFTRGLGTGGGQGATLRSVEEADARCEVLCEQQTGLPVLKRDLQIGWQDEYMSNHMIGWEDLDDMCDKCK